MIRVVLTIALAIAPLLILVFAAVRALCLFSSIRRLFDGGEQAVAPVMDRVGLSIGGPSVSMVLNLDDLPTGKSTVEMVQHHLAQQYGNLEVLLVCGVRSIPTELKLAFDLTETGTADEGTMYRSKRDSRLSCVVTGGIDTDQEWWQVATSAASGEVIVPVDPRWDLGVTAVADLAAPWVRRSRTVASIGLVHPVTGGIRSKVDLVTARADLLAVAGLGTGGAALRALGAMGSGYDGCIVGAFTRAALERIGGVPGPIGDPATWTEIGRRLQINGVESATETRIQILARPLGEVQSSGRERIVDAGKVSRSSWSVGLSARAALERISGVPGDPATWTEIGRRLYIDGLEPSTDDRAGRTGRPGGRMRSSGSSGEASRSSWSIRWLQFLYGAHIVMPFLVALSFAAAVAGNVSGLISSDLLWIAASAPVLLAVVVVLGLMMDDRALRPVGSTSLRLPLLLGAIGASLWGTVGSPLRWTARELDRA